MPSRFACPCLRSQTSGRTRHGRPLDRNPSAQGPGRRWARCPHAWLPDLLLAFQSLRPVNTNGWPLRYKWAPARVTNAALAGPAAASGNIAAPRHSRDAMRRRPVISSRPSLGWRAACGPTKGPSACPCRTGSNRAADQRRWVPVVVCNQKSGLEGHRYWPFFHRSGGSTTWHGSRAGFCVIAQARMW